MTDLAIPTLSSNRLVLRAFRASDLADYAPIRADPAVGRFIGGTLSPEQTWDRMAVMNGQWVLRGYGVFAVELASIHRVVGHAGVLHPIDWPEPEVAYSLGSAYWGQGLAPEAASAVRDWAFASFDWNALASFIDPGNERSIRVAEKLGATRDAALTLRGHVVHRWVHPRPSATHPVPRVLAG